MKVRSACGAGFFKPALLFSTVAHVIFFAGMMPEGAAPEWGVRQGPARLEVRFLAPRPSLNHPSTEEPAAVIRPEPKTDQTAEKTRSEEAEPLPLHPGAVTQWRPVPVQNPAPVYPRQARRNAVAGEVILLVEVTPAGQVAALKVEKSSGHETLDRAALEAVSAWRFSAREAGAVSGRSRVRIPVRFVLDR